MCFSGRSENQDGCPGLWLTETFSTSPLKPLNGIQQNLTGSKISTSSTKFVFFGPIWITRWPSWPLIRWDIFDFSSENAEQNSTKLDRKQDLNVLYQVRVILADQKKNMMAARASDLLRHFQLLLWNHWTVCNETWQEESTSQRPLPLPSLYFLGRLEKQDCRPGQSVKKVAHCTQVHDMWPFGPLANFWYLCPDLFKGTMSSPFTCIYFKVKFIACAEEILKQFSEIAIYWTLLSRVPYTYIPKCIRWSFLGFCFLVPNCVWRGWLVVKTWSLSSKVHTWQTVCLGYKTLTVISIVTECPTTVAVAHQEFKAMPSRSKLCLQAQGHAFKLKVMPSSSRTYRITGIFCGCLIFAEFCGSIEIAEIKNRKIFQSLNNDELCPKWLFSRVYSDDCPVCWILCIMRYTQLYNVHLDMKLSLKWHLRFNQCCYCRL